MRNKYFVKKICNYSSGHLQRISLINLLANKSPIFPSIFFEFKGCEILQYTQEIIPHKWPKEKLKLLDLWMQFKKEVKNMHRIGYVHGDILRKNMLFDGLKFILIDHELSLKHGAQFRVTYPWISIEDLFEGNITLKTDNICMRATELRFFDGEAYCKFRKEQNLKVNNYFQLRQRKEAIFRDGCISASLLFSQKN